MEVKKENYQIDIETTDDDDKKKRLSYLKKNKHFQIYYYMR